ncbi:MAG: RNA polymerase sigma factor [Acidobacteriota bacterium]
MENQADTLLDNLADLPADEALPLLLEAHGGRLYGLSLKLCGHPEDAEDLVQEIFLIALRKWHQFNGEAKPTTWLYTIAARACTRRRRKRAGEPRTMESLTELLPSVEDGIPDLDVVSNPLDEQLRREAFEAVERGIASLPTHFRMPLVLKEIVELPMDEVAEILGLKVATVKTRVHRGRLLLRRELSRTLPTRDAPPPGYSRQMCLDLLKAKQDSLDRGVPFRVPPHDLSLRCQATFATLDLTREALELLGRGEMPAALRGVLAEAFRGGAGGRS